MTEFWETAFTEKQMMWGTEPSRSALFACETFVQHGVKNVLIPGFGYGRNARPFLAQGMQVTGIEISATAIALARNRMALEIPIHHASVTEMPCDDGVYDGIFAYGLLYLLDAPTRAKFLRDCHRQLAPGGRMIFTVIAKTAPMFGQGPRLGDDWYEVHPGVKMFFYDATSIQREFALYGEIALSEINEVGSGGSLPFINIVCTKHVSS